MRLSLPIPEDVFALGEVARAAGVPEADVHALVREQGVRTFGRAALLRYSDALAVGRTLASRRTSTHGLQAPMFAAAPGASPTARAPFAVSTVAHAAFVTTIVLATTLGFGRTTTHADAVQPK